MNAKVNAPTPLPTTFAELMGLHALRPVADDDDLENATDVLDRLAVVNAPTPDQSDYLRTLTLLVEEYEATRDPLEPAPVAAPQLLRYLMDANGMTEADLGGVLGVAPSTASLILSVQQDLTVGNARELGKRFAVSPAIFLGL